MRDERVNKLRQGSSFHHAVDIIKREVDAVVAHAALGEIIGADALRPVAAANLLLALAGAGGVGFFTLLLIEPGAQHFQRLGFVFML